MVRIVRHLTQGLGVHSKCGREHRGSEVRLPLLKILLAAPWKVTGTEQFSVWESFEPERRMRPSKGVMGGKKTNNNVTERKYSKREMPEPEGQRDFRSQPLCRPRRQMRRPEPSVCTQVRRGLRSVLCGW